MGPKHDLGKPKSYYLKLGVIKAIVVRNVSKAKIYPLIAEKNKWNFMMVAML
jgi:hypothetical protein